MLVLRNFYVILNPSTKRIFIMNQPFKPVYILLIAALFSCALQGCNKSNELPPDEIIGIWTVSSATVTGEIDSISIEKYLLNEGYTRSETDQFIQNFNNTFQYSAQSTLEFKADHTYKAILNSNTDTGTWEASSDITQVTIHSSSGNDLVLDVLQLSTDTLHIRFSNMLSDYDLEQDGVNETLSLDVDMTLSK